MTDMNEAAVQLRARASAAGSSAPDPGAISGMRFIVAAKDGAVPHGFACVEHGLLSPVKLARPGRALGAPSSISAARVDQSGELRMRAPCLLSIHRYSYPHSHPPRERDPLERTNGFAVSAADLSPGDSSCLNRAWFRRSHDRAGFLCQLDL